MRIALVCSEVIRESGHGRYMQELARRLASEHEVHVYAHLFQPIPGVTHHPVPAPLGLNLLRVFGFYLASTAVLGREPYDVVHTIGGCTWRHDVVTAQFCQRPWGAHLARQPLPPAKGRFGWLSTRLRRLYHELYWRVCDWLEAPAFRPRPGKKLIAVSGRVRDELSCYYGADADEVAVIYNGVEPAEFSEEALAPLRAPTRAELGIGEDERVLLFVGDFYRKGLATVIEALPLLKTPRIRLLIVGRGEEAAFHARAHALGVDFQLIFTGFQPDVVPYFAAADAFVFPTRYEPFGMVVTEAMAAGLPVVTTRQAGAAEVITEGGDGYLIDDPDDARAIAGRIDALFEDDDRRVAMGRAARKTAARYDWNYVAHETLAVYARTGSASTTSRAI
ncbi:MAG TPA: glycosyltransferase family 4 protein [Oscillatoriaceae cyanobacterium]